MRAETLLALVVFLFPLAYSPGPGNAFFAALGASKGIRATVPALVGYHVATFSVTALVGVGLGVTVLNRPGVARVLAVVGSLYVVWLAWTFICSAMRPSTTSERRPGGEPGVGFWAGVVLLVLNPKAYYIVAVMFTQFLQPPQDDGVLSVLAITTVFTVNNLVAFLIWATAGQAVSALLRGKRAERTLDYVFAVMLIGVAAWMALPLLTG